MISEREFDGLLALYPALLDLPARLRRALSSEPHSLKVSAGELLFDVESPCDAFIMLLSGSVRVIKPSLDGREIMLYRLQAGEMCLVTMSCLLANTNYPARGVVETSVSGVRIPRELFIELVEASPAFRMTVYGLANRVLRLIELIEELAFGRLDQRLAILLLNKGSLIQSTHRRLADELGSTREVVSRLLESFEEQGIVALERGSIRLLDVAALHRIAGYGDQGHRHSRRSPLY